MAKIERRRQMLLSSGQYDNALVSDIDRMLALGNSLHLVQPSVGCPESSSDKDALINRCVVSLNAYPKMEGRTLKETVLLRIDNPVSLRRERRRLRRSAENTHRHARALRKAAKNYVFRPGKTEAELEVAAAY